MKNANCHLEQLFETGKSELDMDYYETRSWIGLNEAIKMALEIRNDNR